MNLRQMKNDSYKYFTEEESLAAVKENGDALRFVKEQTEEMCLAAVKQNGNTLRFVKEQTEEICLAAVKQNVYAFQYIKEQTEEMCLAAVKQDGYALQYVKEQTEEICLAAVKQDSEALQYVNEDCLPKTEEIVWPKKNSPFIFHDRQENESTNGVTICAFPMGIGEKVFKCGVAICKPHDNFNKKLGTRIAKGRAQKDSKTHFIRALNFEHLKREIGFLTETKLKERNITLKS